MMKFKITIALLIIGQLVLAQDRIQKIDSVLHLMYANKMINGNFLIAEKGIVIYNKSFGIANETTNERLNENSIFELASVSKQFTAMGIMILREKGKLDLDDNFTKYIPELSNYKGITIRNLLHHTGGLPDYMQLMDTLFDKSKIATNKDMIAILAQYKPKILFSPNTKFEYSNTGYALLGSIIEKTSGMTFADFLYQNIFKPLQMENTFVYTRRILPKKVENYAYGYVYSGSLKKYVLPDDLSETQYVVWLDGIVGDGTVNASAIDLLKWDRALYTNKLLSKSDMKQVFEATTLNDNTKTEYGLGWFVDRHADFGKRTSHSGSWPGYKTLIERHTDNDKTIIILQNHEDVMNPAKSIRSILYNKLLPVQKIRTEIKMTRDQLQKFIGVYDVEKDVTMTISLDNDQLFAQLTGQNAYPLFAENEMQFFFKIVDAQIHFEKNEVGEISSLFLLQNGNKIAAKRIE